jgi:tetratricopeptide (TPR) repeat protein
MARCFWLILLTAAASGQEAAVPDWRALVGAAREAWSLMNYSEAAEKATAAAAAAEAMPGNEAGILESLRMLTAVERSRGNYAEAARALARALEVSTAQQGPASQQSAGLLSEMASLERSQGHVEQALETIQKAIAMRETAAGLRVEDLARDVTAAAMLEIKLEHTDNARAGLKRAVELWNRATPGDAQVLPAIEALANLHRNAAEYSHAEPLLVHALRLREAATGPDGPEVIALVDSLAYVYFGLKRFPEAEVMYKRLLDLWEKAAGTDHPMRALTLDKMAEFYSFQQRYEEGERCASEALAMRTRMHLASLNQTGRFILMQAKLADAEDLYRRAVQIGDLAKAPDDVMDPVLRVYAGILREEKRAEEAKALDQRVKDALVRKGDREGRLPSPVSK